MKPSTLRKVPSLNYWMPLVEDEEQVVCRIKLPLNSRIQSYWVENLLKVAMFGGFLNF